MAKKLSAWNMFVKKVYSEGKSKNKTYKFRDALKDASKRKGEMTSGKSSVMSSAKKTKKRMGGKRSKMGKMGKMTRKR